ncbi:MAG: DUF423 domain-containing protein [Arenicella sp.]
MNNNIILIIGTLMMFIAISLGAFGAHLWQNILIENATEKAFATASQYHFIHALALLWIGSYGKQNKQIMGWASSVMLVGILIFSGSLYILALTNIRWLGAITPIGGLCLLAAWAAITWVLIKSLKSRQ